MKTSRIINLIFFVLLTLNYSSYSQSTPPSSGPTIYVNPDWEDIARNLEEAEKMDADELEKLRQKYDPNHMPEEEPVPQEIRDMLEAHADLMKVYDDIEKLIKENAKKDDLLSDEDKKSISEVIDQGERLSDDEFDKLQKKYDPNHTPESEPGNQEIKDVLDSYAKLLDATKHITDLLDNNLKVIPKGTGQTTGHIADLSVTNNTLEPVRILPEQFYLPSDGRYQSYVGRIPEGHTIPPGETMVVPVEGYCADVHTPPVPMGDPLPPLDKWIPVLITAPQVPEPMNPPGASGGPPQVPEPMNPPGATAPTAPEPMNPPGASGGPPQVPEPMNPPGATAPTAPEPMNPPGANTPPFEGIPVKLLPRDPVPSFTPELIPEITLTPRDNPENRIIVTFPGTDIPVDGTIDPENNPPVYGTILVEAVNKLENAYDVIRETEQFPTPYFPDPVRERESVIQQTFWIYSAALTGDDYEKDDFEAKVYGQFESTTGKPVAALPEEQQEQVDQGVEDFWKSFQATGLEAKVISVTSPDLIDPDLMLATISSPKCKCSDISYDVVVKRGGVEVHSGSYTSRENPKIAIQDFKYGDAFDVKLSNISANCKCDDADCEFYPAESTKEGSPGYTETDTSRPGEVDIEMDNDPSGEIGGKGNNNCAYKDKEWDGDTKELSFKLETRDEKTNSKSVFQRIGIKGYCQLEDCRRGLCKETIQLNFVTAK